MEIGEWLKAQRKNAGLSQADVAKNLGYESPQFVSNWERGYSLPPKTSLEKIASMFGMNAAEIKKAILKKKIQELEEEWQA